ncbi:hypothetical protein [Duganella sp. FT27W]|uniref:hypothetical protein n=1 Tax=Duganella sp. FT27W TaxID=2654636 RepID=UPI00128C5AF3|nr:hypothetical protein [Duganella sp. FT27W]MPQ56263.1 hypothetical protein [Duganella sp. FT27W]
MENTVNLSADEIRIADNYNREYPGMSRDQAIAKAKQVLADIAARGKEVPPAIATKPVNHHLGMPKSAASAPDPTDVYRDGMVEAFNNAVDDIVMGGSTQ